MSFSEEVRQGYLNHVCDELPLEEWADRIAELEAELEEAKYNYYVAEEDNTDLMKERDALKQALLDQHSEYAEIYNTTIRRALDAEAKLDAMDYAETVLREEQGD